MRRRIAWGLAVLTGVFAIADLAVTASYRSLLSEKSVAEHGFPFLSGAVVLTALLGALIVSRWERHPIGWLLLAVGVTGSFSVFGEAYNIWVLKADGPGPVGLAGVLGWAAAVTSGQLSIGCIALILLLMPDGRLPSRRWRWVPWTVGAGALLYTVALATLDITSFDIERLGLGSAERDAAVSTGFLLILVGLCAGLVSMLLRLRRSDGVRRQQLRLVTVGAALVLAALVVLVTGQAVNGGRQTYATAVPLFVSFLLVPVLHGIAVLRYRLHDVELVVHAALVLALGTAFAAVGYVAVVVVVQGQVDSRAGGWALSLAGTTLVALVFQPLRRRVVGLANRLAYGPRAQPYVALADFSRRLVDTPRPETLLPAVADAAGRAVSARGSTVSLQVPGVGTRTAAWGDVERGSAPTYDVPVRAGGEQLGSITVLLPPGRSLRPADARLLQALADQTATALRNAALEVELTERVARLDATTAELAQSRARLVDAGDAARRALEAAISRDVLPRLQALPGRIADARAAVAAGSADHGLASVLEEDNLALEALRELTRGVFPTQLVRVGLVPAVRSMLAHAGQAPALVVADGAERRFSPRVEATAYFCCAAAAGALSVGSSLGLAVHGDELVVSVDGAATTRLDLEAVADRVAAADGSLRVGAGSLVVRLPAGHPEERVASAQAPASSSGPNLALGT